jgi:hypothetical protein
MSTSASYKHTSRLQPCTYCSVLWHTLPPYPRPSRPFFFNVLAANPPGGSQHFEQKGEGRAREGGRNSPFVSRFFPGRQLQHIGQRFPLQMMLEERP